MLFVLSAFSGSAVEALNGRIGTVEDFLFDDETWRVRWLVIDTATWLPGRKVLIHPSAVAPLDRGPRSREQIPMMSVGPDLVLSVRLTKEQIEASPGVGQDEPVSVQMERHVHDYYGWDPYWGASYFGRNAIATALSSPPYLAASAARELVDTETHPGDGDPHLRSVKEVDSYHIHATDGELGHVENLLADDVNWDIRYLAVATKNWWPGKHVLLAPYAVLAIDWRGRHINLNVTRDQVKSSPPWDPIALIDQVGQQRLHSHYGWPGYGW
jgi:hypothetical protein